MEKIIVVHYLGIKDMPVGEVDKYIAQMSKVINSNKDDSIINYLIPSRNFSDTWIECINPKLVLTDEYETAKGVLDRFYDIHKQINNS